MKKLKLEFSLSEGDEETLSEIKTEELLLKNEIEDDDSNTGAYWEEARKDDAVTNTHEMLLENKMLVKHYEPEIEEHNCNFSTHESGHYRNFIKNNVSSQCDYKIHNKSSLNCHMVAKQDISTIKKFSCYHCDLRSNHKHSLIRHIMVKHNQNISIKIYRCDHCDYKTPNKGHLKVHILRKHDKNLIKKYNCNFCDYKTHYKNLLKNHVLAKHENVSKI